MIDLNIAFVVQMVNVLVLLVILNFSLYRPIRRILAERRADIDGARNRAETIDREVQEKVAMYEARLKEIKTKASEEKGELVKKARQEETSLLEKARIEATDSINTIKNKVAKEAADARDLLKEQARVLSRDICEKVLGRSM